MEKDCKMLFFEEVKKILEGSGKDWENFLRYWLSEEYRQAYLYLEEVIESKRIKISKRYKEIDQEFYGLYIA